MQFSKWKVAGAFGFGAASFLVLSSSLLNPAMAQTANSPAQASPAAAGTGTTLPPVVVQRAAPRHAKRRASRESSSRRAVTGTQTNRGRDAGQAASSAGVRAGATESAWGHVDGYVANRSASGTKTDAPLIETPAAISVVTQDQIQAQGAQDINQALRYTSGVVGTNDADARFDEIYVRGFQADKYLDGLRILNANIFARSLVDPFNLERVEVLHGPASVLYGQASPGGLVDMISKRPTLDPYNEMFLSTGSYGRIQGGLDVSGPIDKNKEWLYRLTASGFDVGSQVDHTDYQRISIAPSLTWRPTNDTTVTFLGTYQNDPKAGFFNQLLSNGIGTLYSTPAGRIPTSFYSGEPDFDQMKREYGSVGYLFEHHFDSVWTVRQNLRYTDNSTYTQLVYPSVFQTDITNIGREAFSTAETLQSFQVDNQAEAKFAAGAFQHTVLFGIDYATGIDTKSSGYIGTGVSSINALNPVYGVPVPPLDPAGAASQHYDQIGGYIQDQIKFDRWVALLGVRRDQADSPTTNLSTGVTTPQSDGATTKRGALLYKFDNGIAPYIQYTESFQPTVGTDFFGNAFKPTTGQQSEVGIKYQPNPKTLLTLAAYDLRQQNVQTADPSNPFNTIQTGEVRSRGIELEGKSEINRNLTVLGQYTYMDIINTKSDPVSQGKHPVGLPRNSASAWADYTFHGGTLDGFGFSGGVRYVGETAGDIANSYYVPGVTLFDAALHYDLAGLGPQFKGFKFQINASNLFDKTYVHLCQDFGCYYGLRRNVIATLRYRW